MPDGIAEAVDAPKVVITGDVRLQVTEQDVARGPVKGRYHLQTQELPGPLQVIWTIEGQVLSRSHHINYLGRVTICPVKQ